jgi:hypothetical protein
MKRYANISKVSGVESYEYDSSSYSYITVKFKSGEILSYLAQYNSVNQIRSLTVLADLGIGLNRYLTKNKPNYVKGAIVANNNVTEDLFVNKVAYPTYQYDKIRWNNGKDWVEIRFKDGSTNVYTIESTGKRDVINIIKYAIKGTGLKQYIDENKPTPVSEELVK